MAEDLAHKIAAGEVVERPASIVKELLENSIDAGATDITVEIEGGGNALIQVRDNGEGIEASDVPLVFQRHATSKIYSFDDLYHINSLGFRGEAMSSIAAVSRVEMVTKTKDAVAGTKILVDGGTVREIVDVGCPEGTLIRVSDIFYNTPVRRKFMKKASTEQSHCLEVISRLALARPRIKFRVISGTKTLLNVQKTADLEERIALVLGGDFRNHALSVDGMRGAMRLRGLAAGPSFTRSNGNNIIIYVNNRVVRDGLLNQAVLAAYRPAIEARKYPAAVLFLDIPPEEVDVNVHPAKREVRFREPGTIFGFISSVLAERLAKIDIAQGAAVYEKKPLTSGAASDGRKGVAEALRRYTLSSGTKSLFPAAEVHASASRSPEKMVFPSPSEPYDKNAGDLTFSSLQFMGQIGGTYLVFSSGDRLVLIDQHAAHERILFERLKRSEAKSQSQRLLLPEIVEFTPADHARFIEQSQFFTDAGFEIEPLGAHTISVKAVPALLSGEDISLLIQDAIDEIEKTGKNDTLEIMKERLFAFIACRAAVKAHHRMSEEEADRLCKDLDATPYGAACPHGRPTFVIIDAAALERMFKRR